MKKSIKSLISAVIFLSMTVGMVANSFAFVTDSTKTLSIIKPDAVRKNHIGAIVDRFEKAGLTIAASKMVQLDRATAEGFYAEHQGKGFFDGLIDFMTSGPVVIMVLSGDDAISLNRTLMGATDPKKAEEGTIRADFGESIDDGNAVHGSDSEASANREINYFFAENEIFVK